MSKDEIIDGPSNAKQVVILAHGAGAPMDTDFMNTMAKGISESGRRVVRFEFPYMAERRATGAKKPPNREPKLRESWLEIIEKYRQAKQQLIIGGKSMGGRIATLVADDAKVDGTVCLGYPFHPTGRPERLRVEHLAEMKTPTVILQGERDTMGNLAEVKNYALSKAIDVSWLTDGDHSFKPRKASGTTLEANLDEAIQRTLQFLDSL